MKEALLALTTRGEGIAKAFAQVEGFTVALCDIKQEWAEGGKTRSLPVMPSSLPRASWTRLRLTAAWSQPSPLA